ncbi:MAG: hypothetical protein WDO24_22810 [Pseudomonadota bacterium]
MESSHPALSRAEAFCKRFDLRIPILMAPMASASPPSLAIAVAKAGGLGACGALPMQPAAIKQWATDARTGSNGAFQINLWIPDPPPRRDPEHEAGARVSRPMGPGGAEAAGDAAPVDFAAQCAGLLEAGRRSYRRSWGSTRPTSSPSSRRATSPGSPT